MILATTRERPGRYSKFAVLTTFEEGTANSLMDGFAFARLFGVSCDPVRLGSGFPAQPDQPDLLSFPDPLPDAEVVEPDAVILVLNEECPWYLQEQLDRILSYQHLRVDTAIQALYAWLFPEPDPDNEEG